jgi:putative hydrolase of the HAD superfamily
MDASFMQAVIFDLWRTLVPLTKDHKAAAMTATAAALNEDTPEFRADWARTRIDRETTALPDYLAGLRTARRASWSPAQIEQAMAARLAAHYQAFAGLRPGTRETLRELRERGARLGLVSNCSSDVRTMLDRADLLPLFDTVTLSAEVGLMKPDPRIFRHAMDALGVTEGYYVGDGDDGELAGARRAGLTDVLFDLGEGRSGTHRVTQPRDVLDLVAGARQ